MPFDSSSADLKRAYELLNVPVTTSAPAIKRAYRAMTKRWHPDLYRAGSPEHAEATQMMKQINEAYATIQRAPLRYRPATAASPSQSPNPSAAAYPPVVPPPDSSFPADRLEFWVRFVCGTILGIFASVGFMIRSWWSTFFHPSHVVIGIVSILLILGCGFGAAYGGDRFWYKIFGVDGW